MSTHHSLLNILKTLRYNDAEIHSIMSAAEAAEKDKIDKINAERDRSILTPIAAAAQSKRHAVLLRQTISMIRTASRHTYELPLDKPVNLLEVSEAIRGASIENRVAIKANLKHLELVA